MTTERPSKTPRPPMRGLYFVRNPVIHFCLKLVDRLLALLVSGTVTTEPVAVRRILVCNGAHLGDVLLTTSVIPALKQLFPGAEFGFLIGSWSRPIVNGNDSIRWIHTVDHWRHNRSALSRWAKLRHYFSTRSVALGEIRSVAYDCAIDLYFYFPNSILLLWQAGIPMRVAYGSAGLKPLLTHPADMHLTDRSMLSYHADLLNLLPGAAGSRAPDALAPSIFIDAATILPAAINDKAYAILHIGSGSALKRWPMTGWRALAASLRQAGLYVVLTGVAEEAEDAAQVMDGLQGVINLCGTLDFNSFANVIKHAQVVIAVDSVAGHLAGAVGTPCLVIGHGMNNLSLWHPVGSASMVIRHATTCAPCYRNHGCETMDCIRRVRADEVLEHALLLAKSGGRKLAKQSPLPNIEITT